MSEDIKSTTEDKPNNETAENPNNAAKMIFSQAIRRLTEQVEILDEDLEKDPKDEFTASRKKSAQKELEELQQASKELNEGKANTAITRIGQIAGNEINPVITSDMGAFLKRSEYFLGVLKSLGAEKDEEYAKIIKHIEESIENARHKIRTENLTIDEAQARLNFLRQDFYDFRKSYVRRKRGEETGGYEELGG